jgi:hypothetical protein
MQSVSSSPLFRVIIAKQPEKIVSEPPLPGSARGAPPSENGIGEIYSKKDPPV